MEHAASRTERDIEQLKRDVRDVRDTAVRAAVRLDAHEDTCVEASKRTQEMISEVKDAALEHKEQDAVEHGALARKVDELKRDIRDRRMEDTEHRRERQTQIDAELQMIRAGNRRILIAIAMAAIAVIGTVFAKQMV